MKTSDSKMNNVKDILFEVWVPRVWYFAFWGPKYEKLIFKITRMFSIYVSDICSISRTQVSSKCDKNRDLTTWSIVPFRPKDIHYMLLATGCSINLVYEGDLKMNWIRWSANTQWLGWAMSRAELVN